VKFLAALILTVATMSASETKPIRVLCWNIHHGVGVDGKLDLERIAKVISDAKPDLVALQEVDKQCSRSGKVDQTAELARLTGMTGVFGKAMDFGGGEYGQAILSRHPIGSHKVHPLPGPGEPRIAFEAVVSIDNSKLKLISLHLDLEPAQRLAQAQTLMGLLKDSPEPAILCGDFNDKPGSPTLAAIVPPWVMVPKQAPAFTYPADKPGNEIDFFFTRGLKHSTPVVVLPEAVASDHRPLLGVFTKN
jgi:endonuclease/exonuclease/phosphatase family metal-dependent hydrolase